MTELHLSRRVLIQSAMTLLAFGLLPGCTSKSLTNDIPEIQLGNAVADAKAAKRFAKAYLAIYPNENNIETIYNAILNSLQRNKIPPLDNLSEVIVELERAIQDDYIEGKIVKVDGWLLSQTEVRLYVLASYNYN